MISRIYDCIEKVRENSQKRSSICRIVLTGRGVLHSFISKKGVLEDILSEIQENESLKEQFVWVESIEDNTNPEIDRKSILEREDFIGDLIRLFEEFYHDGNMSSELKESLDPLFTSPSGRRLLEPFDDEKLIDLIKRAEKLCLDKLVVD